MRKKEPVRLAKKEKKPLFEEEKYSKLIFGIPIEFILIMIIMICIFVLIMAFMGPCTESGTVYNRPFA